MFRKIFVGLACIVLGLSYAATPLTNSFVNWSSAKAVYRIVIELDGVKLGYGTGFMVRTKAGDIRMVTNSHVCVDNGKTPSEEADGQLITRRLDDGRRLHVLKFDPVNDLCLTSFDGPATSESPLSIAGEAAQDGDDIYVIGHPWAGTKTLASGTQMSQLKLLLAEGPYSSVKPEYARYCTPEFRFYSLLEPACVIYRSTDRLDIVIRPGNSGSPIMNGFGNVVGVVWGWHTSDDKGLGVTYAALKELLGYE